MDLAKIRKKSLQPSQEPANGSFKPPVAVKETPDNAAVLDAILTPVIRADAPTVSPATSQVTVNTASVPQQFSFFQTASPAERLAPSCSPLEAILAGRDAAGCNDEAILADETDIQVTAEAPLEFLCVRVSDEIYGINIMDIKEIIKPREVTEVPRAPAFVSGVLSLRGTIIPIIDMRIRLGLAHDEPTGKERIVVIKNSASFSGLLVDEVIQVVQVQQDAVEAAPTVLDGIDRDFVNGIGRSDSLLIIILNLENIADINLY
jgi:purine-binding chemotaxis protein CheW